MGSFSIPCPDVPHETREFILRGFFHQIGDPIGEKDPGTPDGRRELWEKIAGMKWTDDQPIEDFFVAWGSMLGIGSVEEVSRIERAQAAQRKADADQFLSDLELAHVMLEALIPPRHIDGAENKLYGNSPARSKFDTEMREWSAGRGKPVLLLHGKTDSGKSFAAARKLQRIAYLKKGSVKWVDYVGLYNDCNPSMRDDESLRRIGEVRQGMPTFLVIDDLAKTGASSVDGVAASAAAGIIHELLEHRIRPGYMTIITSEYDYEGLAKRMPESIVSRIKKSGTAIHFKMA